jgi:hypothetical protein
MMVGLTTHGHLTAEKVDALLAGYRAELAK